MTQLTPVDVIGGAVRAAGIVELEPTPGGIVLHRMPAWARAQHNDISLPLLETMPSGARLEMTTDATCLELDVAAHAPAARNRDPDRPRSSRSSSTGSSPAEHTTRTGTLIVVDLRTGAAEFQPGGPVDHPVRRTPRGREARRGVAAARGGGPPHRTARGRCGRRGRNRAARSGSTTAARSRTASRRRVRPACGRSSRRGSRASTCRASPSRVSATSTRSRRG